jgi:hypothetical protein
MAEGAEKFQAAFNSTILFCYTLKNNSSLVADPACGNGGGWERVWFNKLI